MISRISLLHKPVLYPIIAITLFFGSSASSMAKTPNYQYTNIAPLPGAGVAINSHGKIDGLGSVQANIPVAYTPKMGYASMSGYRGSHPNTSNTGLDNGSQIFALGFFCKPAVYISAMKVSNVPDEAKALSGQISILDENASHPAVSIGVQDILEKEINSRSIYFVATKSVQLFNKNAYATLGYGGGRFLSRPFGGISVPYNNHINFITEWDGYQLVGGAAWRPGGRSGKLTFLGAYESGTGLLIGANTSAELGR